MKHTFYIGMIFAAAVTAAPSMAAPAPAKPAANANAFLDNKTFYTKINAAASLDPKAPAKQVAAFTELLNKENLSPAQAQSVCDRMLNCAFSGKTPDPVAVKNATAAVSAYLRSPKASGISVPQQANLWWKMSVFAKQKGRDEALSKALYTDFVKFAQAQEANWKAESAKPKPSAAVQRAWTDCQKSVWNVIVALYKEKFSFVKELYAIGKPVFTADNVKAFELGICGFSARAAGDTDAFNKIKAAALALPYGPLRSEIVRYLKQGANRDVVRELLSAELKNPQLDARQKWNILSEMRGLSGSVAWFQRGFNEVGSYERWIACTKEMIKLNDSIEKWKPAGWNFYRDNAYTAFGYGDFAFAEDQISKALALNPSASTDTALMIYLYRKNHKKVSELVAAEIKARNYDPEKTPFLYAVEFFDKYTFKDFDEKFSAKPADVKFVPVSLSGKWTLFKMPKAYTGADWQTIAKMQTVPAEFAGAKAELIQANDAGLCHVDGKFAHQTPFLFVQTFDASADGIMQVGCGADWYYRIFVNGKQVYDRLNAGNGPGKVPTSVGNHTVNLPVKAGKNIIAVALLAGNAGAEICFGEPSEKMSSADKLLLIRQVSELFYRAKRYEVCRDIYSGTYTDMFVKMVPKVYSVRFVKNPPRTADGFVRTAYYNDWNGMESRFVPYGDSPNIGNGTDVSRFLKDSKQPEIDPAWKTGICGLCDAEGLHLYVRGNDPAIEEVVTGKRDGGTLECLFRANENDPYHMFFFTSLPGSYDEVNCDWASASPRYKLTEDVISRDACTSEDGIVAHVFIPWFAFYQDLPLNGKVWHYGMQRWCKGGGFTISGQVHELSRMLNLQFNFTPEQVKAIKRTVCLTAYNKFKNNASLKVWRTDKDLGDPEFYTQVLEPVVKELTDAGAKLDDKNADVDALFEQYVPRWAEFEYTIGDLRRDYLKSKFFK